MRAVNLLTGVNHTFDDETTAEYAVAYAYCEEQGRLDEMFEAAHEGRLRAFYQQLPLVHAWCVVICGDWAAKPGAVQ